MIILVDRTSGFMTDKLLIISTRRIFVALVAYAVGSMTISELLIAFFSWPRAARAVRS